MTKRRTDYKGFYESLVEQIKSYKGDKEEIIELAPELFKIMTNLLEDHRTPTKAKPLINAAIAYFVAPYDVLPEEVHGPIGFMDDIFLCTFVLRNLEGIVSLELLEDNWDGVEPLKDILDQVYPEAKEHMGEEASNILDYVGLSRTSHDKN